MAALVLQVLFMRVPDRHSLTVVLVVRVHLMPLAGLQLPVDLAVEAVMEDIVFLTVAQAEVSQAVAVHPIHLPVVEALSTQEPTR